MKTLKIYFITASLLVAGLGVMAQQAKSAGKGPGAKDKGKSSKGSTQMAVKTQGAPSTVAKDNGKKADPKAAKLSK
jgi:hypothetical protein